MVLHSFLLQQRNRLHHISPIPCHNQSPFCLRWARSNVIATLLDKRGGEERLKHDQCFHKGPLPDIPRHSNHSHVNKAYSSNSAYALITKRDTDLTTRMLYLTKKYGKTFSGTYSSIYVITIGAFFIGFDSGWINPVSLTSWAQSFGGATPENAEGATTTVDLIVNYVQKWSGWDLEPVKESPYYIHFGMAWLATCFTGPARALVAVYITPKVAWFFRKKRRQFVVKE